MALTHAKLIIQSPMALKSLFPGGEIKASYANFGFIPYGHTMVSTFKPFYLYPFLDGKNLF